MTQPVEEYPFAVIMGDIKHSRNASNRQSVQEKFKAVLQRVNEKYAEDIAAQFMITLGDGFQGLVKNKQSILNILFDIEMEMSPIELRFGIGLGDVSTTIQSKNSMENDGTAYHRARKGIETIEANENKYTKVESNIMLFSSEEGRHTDALLNTIFSLTTALKAKWTDRQREVIYAYITKGENQYHAAEALGIGQSSVNKALNAAKFYTYQSALVEAGRFLSQNTGAGE